MKAVRGQKRQEGVDILKKVFNEKFSTTLAGPIRFELQPQGRKL